MKFKILFTSVVAIAIIVVSFLIIMQGQISYGMIDKKTKFCEDNGLEYWKYSICVDKRGTFVDKYQIECLDPKTFGFCNDEDLYLVR